MVLIDQSITLRAGPIAVPLSGGATASDLETIWKQAVATSGNCCARNRRENAGLVR